MNAVVRVLTPSSRDEVAAHQLALPADERRLRFGSPFTDAAILGYAVILNFSRDKLFGVFEEGALVGVAHLAVLPHGFSAQLGLSVAPGRRGRGYGYALLCVSAQHARRVACRQLDVHHLAENRIMVHLARKAGMSVISTASEAGAYIVLGAEPADDADIGPIAAFGARCTPQPAKLPRK